MKFKRIFTTAIAAAIVALSAFSFSASAVAAEATGNAGQGEKAAGQAAAGVKNKDEVVYARLLASGSVSSIYTVNHFSVDKAGKITDYGDYHSVVNLTNTQPIDLTGDVVSFDATEENYDYQGNMAATDLPWVFDFSYTLDGKSILPDELAGQSGNLELQISTRQNAAVDPTFYDNYMLQITVTLDTEKCSNIEAPDGTLASAGKNRVIAYTVLPGGDADFALTSDVQDFAMAGIDVSAMPYSMSMDFPDMDDSLSDLDQLPEAISELNDGVGDLEEGTAEMKSGADSLVTGSSGIKNGLDLLNGNSARLIEGSSKISDGLAQIAAGLSSGALDEIDLSQISALPEGLSRLADGLRGLTDGLTKLKDGFVPAHAALDSAIQAIPDIPQSTIDSLYAGIDPSLVPSLNEVVGAYASAQKVKGTYATVRGSFDAVGGAIDAATGSIGVMAGTLDETAEEIKTSLSKLDGLDKLKELVPGLIALSQEYSDFHSGLVGYANGIGTLASNYGAFHSGIASFSGGVSELNSGIGELYDGTGTLNDEIADLPDLIQQETDKMKDEYMPADFDPVSFTSSKNSSTEFVQFVLQSDSIEKPEIEEEPEQTSEDQTQTFWDRLKALFVKDES
ncbi:MAG: YhgE/Pip domain-containing protein [Christensenellaceae bacterium]|jgi:putative membrane protein